MVERLEACAWVEEPGEELERIRREVDRGDDSWARWLEELERGEAVVAGMRVTVHVRLGDGTSRTAAAENHRVWLEVNTDRPMLEAQIQEIAGKDYGAIAKRLREFGHPVTADDLAEMYVHVELQDNLVASIRPSRPSERTERPAARPGAGAGHAHDVGE